MRRSSSAIFLDVIRQGTERGKNAPVLFVIGAQLEAIALGDLQREFECVDGIEAEPGAEQGRFRVDVRRSNAFEIHGLNDEFGELALGR